MGNVYAQARVFVNHPHDDGRSIFSLSIRVQTSDDLK